IQIIIIIMSISQQYSMLCTALLMCSMMMAACLANNPPNIPYDQSTAEDYLLLSYNAYCPESVITSWNCQRCQDDFSIVSNPIVIYNNSTDTLCYVATYGETVFVAFRGSTDISSWITNMKFFQTSYPKVAGGEVHLGFYEAYMSVQADVQNALSYHLKNCPSCTNIVVTGHSLGGALATLCMADVVEWFSALPTMSYTFGSPRVGNIIFEEYYNSIQPNTWRVVNQKDIVPHVPPQIPIQYHHVSNEIWYPKNATGPYVVCNDSGEDPKCSDAVSPLFYNVYDHLHYFNQVSGCP
ncbi:hypothetical protein SAMD00019534_093820, partial [Acytostelium subglobosum LB1]|uniref:hypothetical protein n=1 Tax=Acytostelium subglobosum LB1 TaxID=1410327 RepID=UPI000644A7B7